MWHKMHSGKFLTAKIIKKQTNKKIILQCRVNAIKLAVLSAEMPTRARLART